jgi:hypothetical protein
MYIATSARVICATQVGSPSPLKPQMERSCSLLYCLYHKNDSSDSYSIYGDSILIDLLYSSVGEKKMNLFF